MQRNADHCLEHGFVLTNEDYSAAMAISQMEKRCDLDLNKLSEKLSAYLDE